jgi:hypothetical protein
MLSGVQCTAILVERTFTYNVGAGNSEKFREILKQRFVFVWLSLPSPNNATNGHLLVKRRL